MAVANFVLRKLLSGTLYLLLGPWDLILTIIFFFYVQHISISWIKVTSSINLMENKRDDKSLLWSFFSFLEYDLTSVSSWTSWQYTVNLNWEPMTQGRVSVFIAISGFQIFFDTVSKRGKTVCCDHALWNGLEPHSYFTYIKMRKVNLISFLSSLEPHSCFICIKWRKVNLISFLICSTKINKQFIYIF